MTFATNNSSVDQEMRNLKLAKFDKVDKGKKKVLDPNNHIQCISNVPHLLLRCL